MVVERRRASLWEAREQVRTCREQMRQGELAMWLNVAYARSQGATLSQLAADTDTSTATVRERLARVSGRRTSAVN